MRAWKAGILAAVLLGTTTATVADVTLTGADLYNLRGSSVFFPTTEPVLSGTSLVFGPDANSLKLLVMPLVIAGAYSATDTVSISLNLNITRLACDNCGVANDDFDPNFLISDGAYMVGALTADNAGGSALGASFVDSGTFGSLRELSATSLFTGAGYPDIGNGFDVSLLFTIAPGVTSTQISYFGKTGVVSEVTRALNPAAGLSFVFLRDLDGHLGGEQYQINTLTVVPEPPTLVLALMGLTIGVLCRRRQFQGAMKQRNTSKSTPVDSETGLPRMIVEGRTDAA